MEGARLVCNQLNISNSDFYKSIASFKGASNRLELIAEKTGFSAYRDFAHAPSKLKATIQAVKEQFPERKLVACFELHTFSSLNKDFLEQYADSMEKADIAAVYYSPHALELKKLPMLSPRDIQKSFGKEGLLVFSDTKQFQQFLNSKNWQNSNLLLMSSGNFDGLQLKEFVAKL
jgi:UDP-N-acetylmuramate: L-alanyl-gamma-D-glutamyl-meso-diaminopimelate ligase